MRHTAPGGNAGTADMRKPVPTSPLEVRCAFLPAEFRFYLVELRISLIELAFYPSELRFSLIELPVLASCLTLTVYELTRRAKIVTRRAILLTRLLKSLTRSTKLPAGARNFGAGTFTGRVGAQAFTFNIEKQTSRIKAGQLRWNKNIKLKPEFMLFGQFWACFPCGKWAEVQQSTSTGIVANEINQPAYVT